MKQESPEEDSNQNPKQKLKITFILPRASLAGGIKSNKLIAEALVRRGHKVSLAFLSSSAPMPSPLRIRTYLKRVWFNIKYKNRIGNHLEKSTAELIPVNSDIIRHQDVPNADVTIATWWETADWIKNWPESKGIKAHFVRGYEIFAGDLERIEETYRLPYQKFVISKWLERLMIEKYGCNNPVLIPNGVDRNQFDSTPRFKAKDPTVGFMYSTHPLKRIETALQALKIVQKELPGLKVISFGGKPVEKRHLLPQNCEFMLSPSQDQIPNIYRSADCWVMSSSSEGFYMPGLEAAACRCPLVSTRCGGPEDFIQHGVSGFLVDIGDVKEMARRILYILRLDNEQWQRMSEASYNISLDFDWDLSAEIMEKALLAMVKRKK